MQEEFASG